MTQNTLKISTKNIYNKLVFIKPILTLLLMLNFLTVFSQNDGVIDVSFNYTKPNFGSLTECRKIDQISNGELLFAGKGEYNIIGLEKGAAIEKRLYNGEFLSSLVNSSTNLTYTCNTLNSNDGCFIAQKKDSSNVLTYNELLNSVQKKCYIPAFNSIELFDFKILNDGSIIACGTSSFANGLLSNQMILVKFTSSFKLDLTFGDGSTPKGYSTISSGFYAAARGLAIQTDGKIVVVGQGDLSNNQPKIIRYNPNGKLDKTFFENGYFKDSGRNNVGLNSVKLDAQNNIYAIGDYDNGDFFGTYVYVIKGNNVNYLSLSHNVFKTLDIDKNDYIYVGGYYKNSGIGFKNPVVKKYKLKLNTIVQDSTFKAFGDFFGVYKDGNNNGISWVNTLKVLNDGKLMVGGIYNEQIFVKRLNNTFKTNTVNYSLLKPQLKIYPNPAQNKLIIEGDKVFSIKIFNITGNLVKEEPINANGNVVIDISNLKPDSYILRYNNNQIYKFIKE